MLAQLTVTNFGLIEHIAIDFHNQLNVLTGETGAGKSILIEALRIALGERINSDQIRDTQKPCLIEAIFEIPPHLSQLPDLQDFMHDNNEFIIQRVMTPDGRNKIKVNGLSVTVTQLKGIGNLLIDFHGPHDHQMLLSQDSHIAMLDRLINFQNEPQDYHDTFKEYSAACHELKKLHEMASTSERELDLLTHQIKELEQVPLEETRYQELIRERDRITNVEKLGENTRAFLDLLSEGEKNVSENIRHSFGPARALSQLDESASTFESQLTELQTLSDQLVTDLKDYAERLNFQPGQTDLINEQCSVYDSIKRKYGPTLDDAKTFYAQAKEKYNAIINREHNDQELQKRISTLKKELTRKADRITQKRQEASKNLKKTIEKELKELGIAHVKFESRVTAADFSHNGQDHIAFFISPNAGEELKPLAEIVSSGEAARVMLALKKALIQVDPIPVLIFDEIDAQIGGRLGTVTGEKLREISRVRQVILITHLPQIASFADHHLKVIKTVVEKRAQTQVILLNEKNRVEEIAQMMSGKEQTEIAIRHAKDMIKKARGSI